MNFDSLRWVVVPHYDGSVYEAYRMFHGDRYRLILICKEGYWSWRIGDNKDAKLYMSRHAALLACTGYLFRRVMHMSVQLHRMTNPNMFKDIVVYNMQQSEEIISIIHKVNSIIIYFSEIK